MAPPLDATARSAPPFSIETIEGDTIRLPRVGRRAVVVAFRTTCTFCRSSLLAWRRMVRRACGSDVILVSAESGSVLRRFWDQHRFSGCAALFVGRSLDAHGFLRQYGVQGTPTHYLIGSDGRFGAIWYGMVSGHRAVKEFLNGPRS